YLHFVGPQAPFGESRQSRPCVDRGPERGLSRRRRHRTVRRPVRPRVEAFWIRQRLWYKRPLGYNRPSSEALADEPEYLPHAVAYLFRACLQHNIGMQWHLVRRTNACEFRNLTRPRFFVQPPWVTPLAGRQVGRQIDLHESLWPHDRARELPVFP